MNYVEVIISDTSFHGSEALTYSNDSALPVGTILSVPLRDKQALGIVVGNSSRKPNFAIKAAVPSALSSPLPLQLLSLFQWMREYYPAPLGILTGLFIPKDLPKKPLATQPNNDRLKELPALSPDQKQALAQIKNPGLHILHGDTGTGKTRIYIELAKYNLSNGKSSIILTPEIGLTSQLQNDFHEALGDRVFVLHSQLTDATRKQIWQAVLESKKPLIIIGARSALFSPLKNVGLIVLDESHESAYKQDQAPYYQTAAVAAKLAALHKATLLLGSATPSVTDYYIAEAKNRPIIRMEQIATPSDLPNGSIEVIDLKDRSKFSRSPYLSNNLLRGIEKSLSQNEQSLVFLNRRGTARVILCESCGWQAVCPHCDLPLVYHADSHLVRCHSCDYKAACPNSCPDCHSTSVVFKSIGTKAIASEIEKLFPGAKIMRFDTDNKKNERIEQHYDAVKQGDVDIIVGTQTLAKGLDLPKLSLVGVVIADTSLYFPDFTAQERTYQLLSQVIGRIGRGHRKGHAVVQTYSPENPLLQAVLSKNWQAFYKNELTERKTFRFPPFCYALKLTCRRATGQSAQTAATKLAQQIQQNNPGVTTEGPAPSFREKIQNKYVWQIIIKASNRSKLIEIIKSLPSGWSYDIDPTNLL